MGPVVCFGHFGWLDPAHQEATWLKAKAEEFSTYIPLMKNTVDRYVGLCEMDNDFWEELEKVTQRVDTV